MQRLEETISKIKSLDSSYWNASLGTKQLHGYAEQLVNDAKTVAAHMKFFGKIK